MRALLITPDVQREITAAVERAAQHPISAADCERLSRGIPQVGDLKLADRAPGFKRPQSEYVNIQMGYRASISFEQQPGGLCRHLSVSVDTPGRIPNPPAVEMIAREFGFVESALRKFWMEEFEPGHHAVNVIELVVDKGTETQQ